MAKSNNAKRKYLIAIIALMVGMIATAGALIGVYAASNQKLGNNFLISYKYDGIAVEVSAQYKYSNSAEAVDLGNVRFDIDSKDGLAYLGTQEVLSISPTNSIAFSYAFKNISKSETVKVVPSWTNFASDTSNMTISCQSPAGNKNLASSTDVASLEFILAPEEVKTITLFFSVDVTNKNAYVSSSAVGGLTFDLQHVA